MKRAAYATGILLLGLCLATAAFGESATKDECVAKTKEAAKLIVDKGLDEAVKTINDKTGPFVWKDTYVFLMDFDGKMIAHPMNEKLRGANVLERQSQGKFLFKEFIAVAKDKGEGWVDYLWQNPGEEKPRKKISFIYRVPGKDLLVGAGIYE